jgi:hypothetical protein
MAGEQAETPDSTAVRVALWRAMHVLLDSPPHVLEDEIGLQLAAPTMAGELARTWTRSAPAGSGRPRRGSLLVATT